MRTALAPALPLQCAPDCPSSQLHVRRHFQHPPSVCTCRPLPRVCVGTRGSGAPTTVSTHLPPLPRRLLPHLEGAASHPLNGRAPATTPTASQLFSPARRQPEQPFNWLHLSLPLAHCRYQQIASSWRSRHRAQKRPPLVLSSVRARTCTCTCTCTHTHTRVCVCARVRAGPGRVPELIKCLLLRCCVGMQALHPPYIESCRQQRFGDPPSRFGRLRRHLLLSWKACTIGCPYPTLHLSRKDPAYISVHSNHHRWVVNNPCYPLAVPRAPVHPRCSELSAGT